MLAPAERWMAMKVRAVAALALRGFDPNEPRDDQGRWTDGGGDGGGSEAEPSAGTNYRAPSDEQIWKWDAQITARQAELEKEGKLGDVEDSNLQQMSGALGHYLRASQADRDSGKVGINAVHDDNKLLAVVSTSYDSRKNAGEITFGGGVDREAFTTALKGAVDRNEQLGAERIDGTGFTDDVERGKAFEAANFRRVAEGFGVTTFRWGKDITVGEQQVARERDRAHEQMVRGMANSVAKDLDFPTDKISFGSEGEARQNFVLNGKQYKAGGLAFTRTEGPEKGTIRLYPNQIWNEKGVEKITAHEIEHIKFQQAFDRYEAEKRAMMADPGPPPNPNAETHWERVGGTDAMMKPDGTLRPPYDQKYPIYQLMETALQLPSFDEFSKGDGVSPYSEEYWTAHNREKTAMSFFLAQHETLAEMAANKYAMGKFPEHKGATPTEKNKNAKVWRDLYRAVDKVYAL